MPAGGSPTPRPLELVADCERCFGLCCVVPAFAKSADFAFDKPAGQPCRNLGDDFRCGIHRDLRRKGFPGCTVYDCFGAGQKVAQQTYKGVDWRDAPQTRQQMFEVFPVMREIHQLLWYLSEAVTIRAAKPIHADLRRLLDETAQLADLPAADLLQLDVTAHWQKVNALLLKTSELAREGVRRKKKEHRGADFVGADLRKADLRGASLRGAYLIGADLREADLRKADVIGADLRTADLRGTDLTGAIFLIQSQLDAANGDAKTKFSAHLTRPIHWTSGPDHIR
jgi:uncharacterized protein YjbI with pentapeptide repeats